MATLNNNVTYVLADTPVSGNEVVLYSLKRKGVDVVIPKATVEEKWTLSDYTKFTIKGRTDKGGFCTAVARTSEENEDELQLLEVKFE